MNTLKLTQVNKPEQISVSHYEKSSEEYQTCSYPADISKTQGIASAIKFVSMAIMSTNVYVVYTIVQNLYEYVLNINREPNVVLIISFFVALVLALQTAVCIYGYRLVTVHTDRTPHNQKRYVTAMNLTIVLTLMVGVLVYLGCDMHQHMYEKKFQKKFPLGYLMDQIRSFALGSILINGIYNLMMKKLFAVEETQPRIVDTQAASIGIKEARMLMKQ